MGESEAQRPLYARLMQAIDVQHTWGNRVGFVKLPLIMLDIKLYGGAIAQFYILTEALEAQLARHADHELVAHVRDELVVGVPLQLSLERLRHHIKLRDRAAIESDVEHDQRQLDEADAVAPRVLHVDGLH